MKKYTEQMAFRVSPDCRKLIEKAAKRQGQHTSEFVRSVAVKAAKRLAK